MPLFETLHQGLRALRFRLQEAKIRRLFLKHSKSEGNFEDPRTYGEKVQFRKLYGNHAFYGRLADKVLVREYVKERVGEDVLIPLLGVYDHLDEGVLDTLPRSFVIKISNASKWNEIVFDKARMDRHRTIRYFNRKLKKRYSRKFGEVHYDYCTPRIVIEELLLDGDNLPWTTDFFCYNNPKGFDFAVCVTSPDELHKGHYDRDWNLLEGNLTEEMEAAHTRTSLTSKMAELARELSRGIDFVRVDLYGVGNRVYFGEMTFTPGAGLGLIKSPERARIRDRMWELDRHNPSLYRNPADVRAGR
jgi:hypothetical protein